MDGWTGIWKSQILLLNKMSWDVLFYSDVPLQYLYTINHLPYDSYWWCHTSTPKTGHLMTPHVRTNTHTYLKPFPLPPSLKSSYSTSSYPFLSHTCSFSLILSNHLILNCYHIWFNYATSPLNLFSLTLSHHSSFLFHSLVPPEDPISLWSTVSPSFFSLPIWCFTSPMRPPLLPCHTRHCFLCCYCLPHPLCFSFSLSDLLWECYLYSNIPRRVEQSRTEQWREFDFPKWASPQKHNKTLLSFTLSMLTPLCLFITS